VNARPKVTWVYDVISPFAYLALPRVKALAADVALEPLPVLFAGLLQHFGQLGPAEIPSKRRFTYRFALWRAQSLKLPMRFPPTHPFNPLAALRLIIAAGGGLSAAEEVLAAVFRDGRDVSDPAVILELARTLGVADPQAALADPAVKAQLRANTEWAVARGVFGVPTLVVDDELFWGHDALEMALDYLRHAEIFRAPEMLAAEAVPVGVMRGR